MRSFELQDKDLDDPSKLIKKVQFVETRMVIRGKDAAHQRRIFGE